MPREYRYQKLEKWLLKGLQEQRWPPGERLPSIRDLCEQQQISKATVLHAYQRLEALGLIESRPKAGYFVLKPGKETPKPRTTATMLPPRPVSLSDVFADIMSRSAAFDILPDLQAGEPSPGITALNRCLSRALRSQRGDRSQYYDQPAGDPGLREQLALHYHRRGYYHCKAEHFCITSGCQHAMFLALMACCQRGDIVAVESPGFYGVLQMLEQLELRVIEIPSSPVHGMDMDALENALKQWPIRACVVSPAYATPSGALMPDSARKKLLSLAEEHDLAIVEDDIYADTGFVQQPDPLKALDQDNRVILCSSFSKSLSRDLRLGWIDGARWHARILRLKLVTQLASSRYLQQGVCEFIRDGGYRSYLKRQRLELRNNRDQLIHLIQQHWPKQLSKTTRISQPNGGLALWLELDNHQDTLSCYQQALQQGIVITPGALFSVSGQHSHCLRLSFAHHWDDKRTQALTQLGQVLNA
ncbi:PLP-dependent aminotransferase family protein [Oceanospirillum beijerinckii]|uniref:aminotransferase-like domain-containing protein n=1 Tax=Oceanospirillum beijerinckii TaxID=64976 RepID=UPI0004180BDC|nr:PLP-dependent aminotransferase family protein [Oceanospirillum beijerinckii]